MSTRSMPVMRNEMLSIKTPSPEKDSPHGPAFPACTITRWNIQTVYFSKLSKLALSKVDTHLSGGVTGGVSEIGSLETLSPERDIPVAERLARHFAQLRSDMF